MAKYRVLSIAELEEMEKEFIDYLVLNGIAANDWQKLKKSEPKNAEEIIELFSDVVFETIMRKTHYLEKRGEKEIRVLQCLKDKFVLVGINASKIDNADLTNPDYLRQAVHFPPSGLEVFTSEIKYEKLRELEIFEMTQQGYSISNGDLFKTICLVIPQ